MTRINALSETRFYMIDKNWDQYEYDWKEYRTVMKARKREKVMEMIAEEIIKTRGKPQPSKDLFS
jgi:hypothetical protein